MSELRRPSDPEKYYSLYDLESHPEGLTKEEVETREKYATHDLIIFSMIHTSDGGLSTLINSTSHAGGELTASEYFKAWGLFTELVRRKLVSEGESDGPGSRLSFINTVWETFCSALTGGSHSPAENVVTRVSDVVKQLVPGVEVSARTRPKNEDGSWWLDLQKGDKHVTLEFSLKKGWGVSHKPDGAYGEGPDEIFTDSEQMILRVMELFGVRTCEKCDGAGFIDPGPDSSTYDCEACGGKGVL